MTMKVKISHTEEQSNWGIRVEVMDQFGDRQPVVASTTYLRPGEEQSFGTTHNRWLRVTEVPMAEVLEEQSLLTRVYG